MVFFTCSHCGESVKKPSVTKHYMTKCKNKVPFLTCVDCLKDFKGNEHEAHTKCVTEEERYSAKGFVPKSSSNKGERKQRAWSECSRGLLSAGSLDPDERAFLEFIVKFENLPRKKVKFLNFVKTSARHFLNKPNVIDSVWEKLENYFKESNSENQKSSKPEDSGVANGKGKCEEKVGKEEKKEKVEEKVGGKEEKKVKVEEKVGGEEEKKEKVEEKVGEEEGKVEEMMVEEETKKKKRRKRKKGTVKEGEANKKDKEDETKKNGTNANEAEEQEEPKAKKSKKCQEEAKTKVDEKENIKEEKKTEGTEDSFVWKDAVLSVITTKGEDNKIPFKKLKKKVLSKYCSVYKCQANDKIARKFLRKLKKMKEVTVNADCVTLNAP